MNQNKNLGRISLKKVRVEQQVRIESEESQSPTLGIFMGVPTAIQDSLMTHLGERMSIGLERKRLKPEDLDKPNGRFIFIDGQSMGRTATRACRLARSFGDRATTVIILLDDRYADIRYAQSEKSRLEADVCIQYPTSPQTLVSLIDRAIEFRRPFKTFTGLPKTIAETLDRLEMQLHNGSYFELFGVRSFASMEVIRHQYSILAKQTHPDRHNWIRRECAVAFDRVHSIHKRLTEAQSVLNDSLRRSLYTADLRRRGTLRYLPDDIPTRSRHQLSLCQTEATKEMVAECIEARSMGDWARAKVAICAAAAQEPDNQELLLLRDAVVQVCAIALGDISL